MTWWLLVVAVAAFILWRRHRARQLRGGDRSAPPAEAPPEFGRRKEPPPSPQRAVTETHSVVLRRQVPPRDEAPRSWLGGLPMMPDEIAWPRSVSAEHPQRGERPLHFVAQTACADLPAALWGGLGPRQGWLLFFVDPNQGVPEGSDAFRVLHVDALGAERAAPADLGPVHDGVYTGPSYDWCRTPEEVPSLWRRWPVDLVTVPNTLHEIGRRKVAAPENFAALLYPDQPTATERGRTSEPEPFTWRGALHVLGSLERSFSAKLQPFHIPDRVIAGMNEPGMHETLLRVLDEKEAHWNAQHGAFLSDPEPAEEQERKRHASMLAATENRRRQRGEIAAFLAAHPTAEAMLEAFRRSDAERRQWHEAARDRIAAERPAILERDLDSPLDSVAWQAVKHRLQQDRYAAWTYDWDEWKGVRSFGLREVVSRIDFARVRAGGEELIADYYTDPARRSLVPSALVAAHEPAWRRLEDNMPHRMGGYHDGVQSDPEPGPAKELLLFQIVSDAAMNWCWGDLGAYYVFIAPDDLERGDFTRATMTLECH